VGFWAAAPGGFSGRPARQPPLDRSSPGRRHPDPPRPGPLVIVRLSLIAGKEPPVRFMVPARPGAKVVASKPGLALAWLMAQRKEPEGPSARLAGSATALGQCGSLDHSSGAFLALGRACPGRVYSASGCKSCRRSQVASPSLPAAGKAPGALRSSWDASSGSRRRDRPIHFRRLPSQRPAWLHGGHRDVARWVSLDPMRRRLRQRAGFPGGTPWSSDRTGPPSCSPRCFGGSWVLSRPAEISTLRFCSAVAEISA
jgi:hypothetical protein